MKMIVCLGAPLAEADSGKKITSVRVTTKPLVTVIRTEDRLRAAALESTCNRTKAVTASRVKLFITAKRWPSMVKTMVMSSL